MPSQPEAHHGESRRPVVRFLVVFGILIAAFYAVYIPTSHTSAYHAYLGFLARSANVVLRLFGSSTSVTGRTIESEPLDMDIVPGCDGMEALGLFCSAVLASPVSVRYRLIFLFPGVLVLSIVNLTRIVTLYYVGVHRPALLDLMHLDIWPGLLVMAILSCWIVWARWAWHREGATVSDDEQ